jgi:hypothetical protein
MQTDLGALTDSKVKVTSGAGALGAFGFPSKITVSPDNTDLTRADPVAGRIMGGFAVAMVT